MSKTDVLHRIREVGIVPVVRAESADEAGRAIAAIMAGGVPVLEITMTVPGAVPLIADLCRRYGIPIMPGALTPTEVVAAWEAGADMVKVFPCSALGGASYIKALKAPLPQIDLIPTGGVNLQTAAEFIKAGSTALGVGADLVDLKALREGQDALLTDRARKLVEIVRTARAS